MSVYWRFQAFDALTVAELYAVLRLRSEVFVVEQACVFQDMDGADAACHHLLAMAHAGLHGACAGLQRRCVHRQHAQRPFFSHGQELLAPAVPAQAF